MMTIPTIQKITTVDVNLHNDRRIHGGCDALTFDLGFWEGGEFEMNWDEVYEACYQYKRKAA